MAIILAFPSGRRRLHPPAAPRVRRSIFGAEEELAASLTREQQLGAACVVAACIVLAALQMIAT